MSEEKRKYMRFNVLMDAVVHAGGMLKKLKVNNFSKEGMGIISKDMLNKGDDIEIELTIPGDNVPVLLGGEIAWACDPITDNAQNKYGVKFKKVDNSDRGRILEYIYHRWLKSDKIEVK